MILWHGDFFLTRLRIQICYDGILDLKVQVRTWYPKDNKIIITTIPVAQITL